MTDDALLATIRDFIMREFVPGQSPDRITPELNLLETGILDSLAVVHLVDFLEELCGTSVASSEVNPNTIGSLNKMVQFVKGKQAQGQ